MGEEVIKLSGTISLRESLSATLSVHDSIVAEIGIPESVGSHPYEGDYVVKPKMHEETVLATNGKLMNDDVTVLEIPYFETSNLSGGTTVYIATEDY